MTLKWGSTTVTAVKWGSTTCTAVYWGSTKVWPDTVKLYINTQTVAYAYNCRGTYTFEVDPSYTYWYQIINNSTQRWSTTTINGYRLVLGTATGSAGTTYCRFNCTNASTVPSSFSITIYDTSDYNTIQCAGTNDATRNKFVIGRTYYDKTS